MRRSPLILFLAVLPVIAQQASISGVVSDSSGLALPAATITIKNVETGSVRTLTADEMGRYSAPGLAVGQYQVTAAKEGFRSSQKTGIALTVGQENAINLTLSVGEISQTVTVEAAAAPVNLSTDQISGLVGERQVKDLPLNGRSYDGLMTLNPGIVNYSSQRSGGIGTSNSAVGNMFAVSGRRPQ
jgi:hypothetical protein